MSVHGVSCATSEINIVAIANAFVSRLAMAAFALIVMSKLDLQI